MENKWKSSGGLASTLLSASVSSSTTQSGSMIGSTTGSSGISFANRVADMQANVADDASSRGYDNRTPMSYDGSSKLEELTRQLNQAKDMLHGAAHLQSVKISSVSMLRIIRHSTRLGDQRSHSGSLLGLDLNGYLEVTNCIPLPASLSSGSSGADDSDFRGDGNEFNQSPLAALAASQSQRKTSANLAGNETRDANAFVKSMLKQISLVNVDNNVVGWYKSIHLGRYSTPEIIQAQFELQENLDYRLGKAKSVLIVFDPQHSINGSLYIKALRLTETFMNAYRLSKSSTGPASSFSAGPTPFPKELMTLSANEIFEEIPVQITNSALLQPLLGSFKNVSSSCFGKVSSIEKKAKESSFDTEFGKLELASSPYIERNLQFLIQEISSLQAKQREIQDYQKEYARKRQGYEKWIAQRRAENAIRKERGEPLLSDIDGSTPVPPKGPSRIESTIIRKQIGAYCDQTNKYVGSGLTKLYLYNSIQHQQQQQQ